MRNNHNTHFATANEFLEYLRIRVVRDLDDHPLGSSSFYLSKQETRGYRLALSGVLGIIDGLRKS